MRLLPNTLLAMTSALSFILGCAPDRRADETIVIAVESNVESLVPFLATNSIERELAPLLFRPLNSPRWRDGEVQYDADALALSTGWVFADDSATLIYELRADARWSDGEPVDANDVVFTYELYGRTDLGSPYATLWEQLDSVIALDAHRVGFYFERRHPRMLLDTTFPIMPEHIFAAAVAEGADLTSHPANIDPVASLVFSGPFRVAEWRPGERLILAPNEGSGSAQPLSDRVVFRVTPEETTRLIELENRTIDMAYPLSATAARRVAGDADLRTETTGPRFYDYIIWNSEKVPAFADPDVRLALSLAIDREAILTGLGFDGYIAAAGPYPPIFRRLADPEVMPDPYDPDRARAILAGAGWHDSNGDGVLDRDGRSLQFTVMTDGADPERTQPLAVIQQQLSHLGVDAQVRTVERSTLLGLVYDTRDFEAALTGWQVSLDPSFLEYHLWPADAAWNVINYSNPRVDSLIPLALDAPTAESAAHLWRDAAREIAHDRPFAFLWFYGETAAFNERLGGVRVDLIGVFQNLHEWTVR